MRFGSSDRFAIDIAPVQATWEHVAPDDQGPWAEWTLWVDGQALTRHQLPGEDRVRTSVHLPLLPIKRWFQSVGWAQRAHGDPSGVSLPEVYRSGEEIDIPTDDDAAADQCDAWWERHCLPAADTGAWLPQVAFVRSEDHLWISWQPHRPAGLRPPLFDQPPGNFAVTWTEATSVVEEFCQAVEALLSHPPFE